MLLNQQVLIQLQEFLSQILLGTIWDRRTKKLLIIQRISLLRSTWAPKLTQLTKEKLTSIRKLPTLRKKSRRLTPCMTYLVSLYILGHLDHSDITIVIAGVSNLKTNGTNVMMKVSQNLMVSMEHWESKLTFSFIRRECRSYLWDNSKRKLRLKLNNRLKNLKLNKLIYLLLHRVQRTLKKISRNQKLGK